jgi:hypothetical protein
MPKKLIGTAPEQVPLNQFLGSLAFQGSDSVSISGGTINNITVGGTSLNINTSSIVTPNGLNFDSNTLVIDAANDRVGLGINIPERQLHVRGSNAVWRLDRDVNTASLQLFRFPSGDYTSPWKGFLIGVNASGVNQGELIFGDYGTSTTGGAIERMRISSDGNVLIGTITDNGSKLNVDGTLSVTGNTSIGGTLTVTGTTNTVGHFNAGTTAPTGTTRLNYNGDFYATNIYASTVFQANTTSTRDKYRVWSTSAYAIGMQNSITYGAIDNNYAMTFQMDITAGRGFWWGTNAHTTAQGAMALSTSGLLSVASGARIGYGVSDTTLPTANVVDISGLLTATTKSFTIKHPTKEGKRLRYGSLEGPENGVYVRGKQEGSVIELPEYWSKLVDPDSITVQLTPIGKHQKLYVEDIRNNKVYVGVDGFFADTIKCFYYVLAERADVEKLQTEID